MAGNGEARDLPFRSEISVYGTDNACGLDGMY